MGSLSARTINCPNKNHPREKILLLLGKDCLFVHCKDHQWIKIELSKAGVPINFDDTSVVLTTIGDTHFDLEPVPALAVGNNESRFQYRRKNHG